ncbi:MAG: adenylate/guanylate cyclase domain-containing protein [Mesorhizobium sp.]|nr:MAG: adenylate/guanylate cyclase domain-containing protein [Mesorhizobium sp.]TIL43240.1 MAG: adenylate/guanylate cyclase domain-containing protein [Mesorhizobium sp.]TIL49518.1 MAG: adenylate/guanylate cyclase domain-containing protein [Mesorhizobium sp.]TIL84674.1 MAG: adenylate/guanylate cyclase domain-containing protein [Mesorhizobium sp.]
MTPRGMMPAQRSELAEASLSTGPVGLEYPPDLQLVRRRPISLVTTEHGTALDWLMSGTAASAGPAELLDGVIARLVAAGQPIERATLNMSTLHPQLVGITAHWRGDLGVCDEVEVNAHVRETTDYLTSPLRPIIEEGRSIRVNPQDSVAQSTYPIMRTLAEAGYTDYWGFALKRDDRQFTLMTLATRQAGGFSRATIEAVEALRPALALNVEIVSRGKIAEHVLDAYLGRRIGKRVLAGDIRRGFGETIEAVIWVSDMRNFTSLSDRIDSAEMIWLLNAFFEGLVDAVHEQGGEVLKFVGDGMLAAFPIFGMQSAPAAAAAALAAARNGLVAVDSLNEAQSGEPSRDLSWRPLSMGIALHRGPVFFGNIGSRDRLDFTAIGRTVNLAARIEPLSKTTGRRLLLSDRVAELIEEPVEELGDFPIRGIPDPVSLFTVPEHGL